MAAPATQASSPFVAGLLQSLKPWMTGASPGALDQATSQYGGMQGLLSAMLQDRPGSGGAAAFGRAMQGVQNSALQRAAQRQKLASNTLGLNLMAAKMPGIIAYYRALGSMMGGGQQQSAQGASSAPATPSPTVPVTKVATPAQAESTSQGESGEVPADESANAQATVAAPQQPQAPARRSSFWSNPLGVMRFGAIGSAFGLPGASQFSNYGKTALQYDPEVASELAAAKGPVRQDIVNLRDAYASGNPRLIQAMNNKLLTDTGMQHIGSMSGIYTRVEPDGSVTTYNPSTGLETNTKSGARYMPGALGALAARQGAEERARIAAGLSPVGGGNPGNPSPQPAPNPAPAPTPAPSAGATPAKTSAEPQGEDALNAPGYVPPILEAPSKEPVQSGNIGIEAVQEFQKDQAQNAKEEQDKLREGADAAQTLITQSQEVMQAANDFHPGKFAQWRGEVLATLQPLGVLSDQELKSLGSYQEGAKLSIQMQALATKMLGSREAQQIFEKMGKSIPGLTLSPDGLSKIAAYMEGMGRYKKAMSVYGQRLAARSNVAGLNSLEQNFQQYSNPAYYIIASAPTRVKGELLSAVPDQKDFLANWRKAAAMGLAPRPFDYEGR